MYDVYGTICTTYEEACLVAGVDTPEQLRREAEAEAREGLLEELRERAPAFQAWLCVCARAVDSAFADEIPF